MPTTFEQPDFLRRLKDRDRKAAEEMIVAHTKHLYHACLGLGFSAPEAEDITQSSWAAFFDSIHAFEGRSKLRTFLFGILYNKASEYRKKGKRLAPEPDIERLMDRHFNEKGMWLEGPKDPEKFFAAAQTAELIFGCMEHLPFPQRMAFHLKEVEGELTEEICRVLSVSANNLGVLLYRARNQLRECLQKKAR
jgi:RNA polymerase sigma-70 factor, ECF subfamily